MALLAHRVRAPIVTAVALVGLTLAMSPERNAHRCTHTPPVVIAADMPATGVIEPAAFADARPWNRGGMVMGVPATGDPIAHNALSDLLSALFDAVRSLRV